MLDVVGRSRELGDQRLSLRPLALADKDAYVKGGASWRELQYTRP